MMIAAIAAVAAGAAVVPAGTQEVPQVAEAAHAIEAGRLDQARLLIARAIAKGAPQPRIDRLLADLAFARGDNSEALLRYEHILHSNRTADLCEKASIAALRLGQVPRAGKFADCAIEGATPSWRAWNARGAIFDYHGDWAGADRAYQRAAEIAPDRAEILNNQGWSRLLRGDWSGALTFLERAAQIDPKSVRIVNNLELARVGAEATLPERHAGESAEAWAHRLNDAGMAARLLGNRQKAIAAFTRALEASETWYARAANNLQQASAEK